MYAHTDQSPLVDRFAVYLCWIIMHYVQQTPIEVTEVHKNLPLYTCIRSCFDFPITLVALGLGTVFILRMLTFGPLSWVLVVIVLAAMGMGIGNIAMHIKRIRAKML